MDKETPCLDYKTELIKNRILAFVPGGNSMWPTLKNRGQSVIVLVKTEKLKRFDVAFYVRSNGAYVLHRVMEATDYGYVMCGDSQTTLEKVLEEQVFGVMTGFYRGEKYIDVKDEAYIAEIESWYGNKKRREAKLKRFYFRQRVNAKIKRIFRIFKVKKNV